MGPDQGGDLGGGSVVCPAWRWLRGGCTIQGGGGSSGEGDVAPAVDAVAGWRWVQDPGWDRA